MRRMHYLRRAMRRNFIAPYGAYQVAPHIAAGELEVVLPEHERTPAPIHALYPSARLLPARVRAFVELALADGVREF